MPTFKNFTDTRDGKVYKCVLMPDGKWWTAENLAYESGSCLLSNLAEYNDPLIATSRLYTLADAEASKIPGTHLPTKADLLALGTNTEPLKSDVGGWNPPYASLGSNATGLSLIGAASRTAAGAWDGSSGYVCCLWGVDVDGAWQLFFYGNTTAEVVSRYPLSYTAVRLIVDTIDPPTIFPPPGKYYQSPTITLSSSNTIHYTIS